MAESSKNVRVVGKAGVRIAIAFAVFGLFIVLPLCILIHLSLKPAGVTLNPYVSENDVIGFWTQGSDSKLTIRADHSYLLNDKNKSYSGVWTLNDCLLSLPTSPCNWRVIAVDGKLHIIPDPDPPDWDGEPGCVRYGRT
jgi:hypothetical protein